ncbi:sugar-binding domain-containing protein, partial [Flavicella sp.]|uniref:sugar-binding domain-containing protein n=1 Tax=Flavicella sp. TaxID=2957742 RepID=UPI00260497CD
MRIISLSITILLLFVACSQEKNNSRETIDFNKNWKFELVEDAKASSPSYDDSEWRVLDVPHDWSIEKGYNKEKGAASTGFVEGGMGWYRKHFSLSEEDKDKVIEVLFDGVYNNSSVWINGHFLGKRPYGYSSFSYNLTDYLNYDGSENILAVQVDRKAFIDSRWYTGSGIYRNVHLIKKNKMHIKQWGVQITIPVVSKDRAELAVVTNLSEAVGINSSDVLVKYSVFDADDNVVTTTEQKAEGKSKLSNTLLIENPRLWGVDSPNLYRLKVELLKSGEQIDVASEVFGIRTFNFDANKGFSLNGENMKIKGVNLHHDGGAVGAAVPKAIWEYRIDKLKSIGVNAVRMSHNPHSTELMEVCDEKGILVMAEAFDEWYNPKKKSLNYLGDNAASKEDSKSYPSVFNEWAERDLKDLILRDFNHPSVFMWSIGNEIEWTFPYYAKSYA